MRHQLCMDVVGVLIFALTCSSESCNCKKFHKFPSVDRNFTYFVVSFADRWWFNRHLLLWKSSPKPSQPWTENISIFCFCYIFSGLFSHSPEPQRPTKEASFKWLVIGSGSVLSNYVCVINSEKKKLNINKYAFMQSAQDSWTDVFIWSFQMCSKQRSKHLFFYKRTEVVVTCTSFRALFIIQTKHFYHSDTCVIMRHHTISNTVLSLVIYTRKH